MIKTNVFFNGNPSYDKRDNVRSERKNLTVDFTDISIKRRHFLAGTAGALVGTGAMTRPSRGRTHSAFIRREGTGFVRHGRPWRLAGANAWYLAWLGSAAASGDRARLALELDRLQALGITNVRLLVGAEEGPLKHAVTPGFINKDGKLNHDLLVGLDHALAELARRNMTGVLYLTNNWEWSGGMMTLLWYETGDYIDNNDPAYPWPDFPDRASAFYANAGAVRRYFSYVRALVSRVNTVTGKRYVEDPTIMAWQLCNEPRPGVRPKVMEAILPDYYRWIDTTARLIRSLDSNHMVSLGMEGTIATNGREDIVLRAHEHIDYMTTHVWPLNWGWVDDKDLAGTWAAGAEKVEAYVDTHIRLAKSAGKPLVIEEFGFPRDGGSYDPRAGTTFREKYYHLIYGAAEKSLAEGGPVAGTNFWAWNGEARAQHADFRFHPGDTQWMGDPPHEPQGWYGNFDSDTAIQAIIRTHARDFATAT